ncbi:MAG: hypothetical protein WBP59_11550, partial [Ilumatobacteraceae bacterium]
MKKTAAITLAIASLLVAGCGSDSDGGLDGPQGDAAKATIEAAADAGVELDEDCVNEVAAKLSDADATIIATNADEDVSDEGIELAME